MAKTTWDRQQAKKARDLANDILQKQARAEAERRAQYYKQENERASMAYSNRLQDMLNQYQSVISSTTMGGYYPQQYSSSSSTPPKQYHKMEKLHEWKYDYSKCGFARAGGSFIGDRVLHSLGIHQATELTDDMITSAFVNEKLRICKEDKCSGEEACRIMQGGAASLTGSMLSQIIASGGLGGNAGGGAGGSYYGY